MSKLFFFLQIIFACSLSLLCNCTIYPNYKKCDTKWANLELNNSTLCNCTDTLKSSWMITLSNALVSLNSTCGNSNPELLCSPKNIVQTYTDCKTETFDGCAYDKLNLNEDTFIPEEWKSLEDYENMGYRLIGKRWFNDLSSGEKIGNIVSFNSTLLSATIIDSNGNMEGIELKDEGIVLIAVKIKSSSSDKFFSYLY
jgi:hypothetical protein